MNSDCDSGGSNLNFEKAIFSRPPSPGLKAENSMPTISLYRLTAPVGSIKKGDGTRRTRRQIDYGAIVGALILAGLLVAIIWN